MIVPEINTLSEPIREELKQLEDVLKQSLKSDVELINIINDYILSNKGKRIRPMLLLLCAKLCGEVNETALISASLVEILHTATLVHDDIVDQAETRRGLPSINAIWKNKVSVLLGDYLFSRSLMNMVSIRDYKSLDLLSKTSELLSAGEILQIEKSYTDGMTEEIYYDMITAKTASLFAASCELGARSVNSDEEKCKTLYQFGKALGMAFQIKDDLLDYVGSQLLMGKPLSRDIKENLVTLPLIFCLNGTDKHQRDEINRIMERGPNTEEIDQINSFVKDNGGVTYAQEKLNELTENAIEHLDMFPDSEVKRSLIGFTIFNGKRSK